MKTATKMKEEGFNEISTVECLLREMQVRKISQNVFDPLRQPTPSQHNNDNDEEAPPKKRMLETDEADDKIVENPAPKVGENQKNFVTAVPLLKMPGHTGFLTFASLPPSRDV